VKCFKRLFFRELNTTRFAYRLQNQWEVCENIELCYKQVNAMCKDFLSLYDFTKKHEIQIFWKNLWNLFFIRFFLDQLFLTFFSFLYIYLFVIYTVYISVCIIYETYLNMKRIYKYESIIILYWDSSVKFFMYFDAWLETKKYKRYLSLNRIIFKWKFENGMKNEDNAIWDKV